MAALQPKVNNRISAWSYTAYTNFKKQIAFQPGSFLQVKSNDSDQETAENNSRMSHIGMEVAGANTIISIMNYTTSK